MKKNKSRKRRTSRRRRRRYPSSSKSLSSLPPPKKKMKWKKTKIAAGISAALIAAYFGRKAMKGGIVEEFEKTFEKSKKRREKPPEYNWVKKNGKWELRDRAAKDRLYVAGETRSWWKERDLNFREAQRNSKSGKFKQKTTTRDIPRNERPSSYNWVKKDGKWVLKDDFAKYRLWDAGQLKDYDRNRDPSFELSKFYANPWPEVDATPQFRGQYQGSSSSHKRRGSRKSHKQAKRRADRRKRKRESARAKMSSRRRRKRRKRRKN